MTISLDAALIECPIGDKKVSKWASERKEIPGRCKYAIRGGDTSTVYCLWRKAIVVPERTVCPKREKE